MAKDTLQVKKKKEEEEEAYTHCRKKKTGQFLGLGLVSESYVPLEGRCSWK